MPRRSNPVEAGRGNIPLDTEQERRLRGHRFTRRVRTGGKEGFEPIRNPDRVATYLDARRGHFLSMDPKCFQTSPLCLYDAMLEWASSFYISNESRYKTSRGKTAFAEKPQFVPQATARKGVRRCRRKHPVGQATYVTVRNLPLVHRALRHIVIAHDGEVPIRGSRSSMRCSWCGLCQQ